MSSATLDYDSVADADEAIHYRALHTGAPLGLVLGLSSVFMVVTAGSSLEYCLLTTPIPLLGIFVSLRSLAKIRSASDQYTGSMVAWAGLVLSLFFLMFGLGYGGYVYATEVPEGYARISFNAMRPDTIQESNGVVVPPEIADLDGKRVFIKGYIRPDSITVSKGIDRFLLVRDNNQCCFGDLSTIKYFDQIDVAMIGSKTVDYSPGLFRMGGILKVMPENAAGGPGAPVFALQADYAN
jgi:hypothetical protein